jgi:hypothetical protein
VFAGAIVLLDDRADEVGGGGWGVGTHGSCVSVHLC